MVGAIATFGFLVFILSGGLFVLMTPSTPTVQKQNGLSFAYPGDIHNTTIQESIFASIFTGLGIAIIVGVCAPVFYVRRISLKNSSPA